MEIHQALTRSNGIRNVLCRHEQVCHIDPCSTMECVREWVCLRERSLQLKAMQRLLGESVSVLPLLDQVLSVESGRRCGLLFRCHKSGNGIG